MMEFGKPVVIGLSTTPGGVIREAHQGDATMDENTFQKKLTELMGEISTLPTSERAKLTELAAKTQERHEKLKKTVGDLQESLDYLRLSIKYLVFDLEATRRENGYLRKMLENASSNNDERDEFGDQTR
jgi:predicted  nucleic acid-binding Zn-ribbon protein